jgi:chemotaxis protein methyltransferase CheR
VSTGQEAYSIAMTLREFFPELSSWNIFIQATDISPNILTKAKSGIYSQSEINRGLDPCFLQKYFTKNGKDSYQINSSIREMISFLPHNLVDIWPFYPKFELVMLRNVLIYFSQETKNKVLDRTHKHLSNEGVLILGAAESIYLNPLFKLTQLDKISYYSVS